MRLLIVGMLIVLLLFAGCIQGSQNQTTLNSANQNPQTQNQENHNNQVQEQPNGEINEQNQENQETPQQVETIAALITKGKPIECTYTVEENGRITTYKVYMLQGKTRVDGNVNGMSYSMISLREDGRDVVYVKGDYQMEGCDWIKMSYETEEVENPAEDINYDDPVDTEVETTINGVKGSYECHVGSFGDEKFVPDGKVCDFAEIYSHHR